MVNKTDKKTLKEKPYDVCVVFDVNMISDTLKGRYIETKIRKISKELNNIEVKYDKKIKVKVKGEGSSSYARTVMSEKHKPVVFVKMGS